MALFFAPTDHYIFYHFKQTNTISTL